MPAIDPINTPIPITATEARNMYNLYNGTFNPGFNNTTTLTMGIQNMHDMLDAMQAVGADHLRIYFGALPNDGVKDGVDPFVQITAFFQAAAAVPTGSDNIEDLGFERISPYDVVHPCPPPACGGKSNY